MSTADFLLELRSEEIPARMQAGARADLEKLFRREMQAAGLAVGDVTVWSTPRRLTLIAKALPLATEAVHEETKGPRTSAPEQALEGFLRKTGLAKDQLTERDGVWFAVVEKPGRAAADVLAAAIPAIIRAFLWPKSQRWGAASHQPDSLRWVRPLSGIVALLGDDLIDCEIGGIRSGTVTLGHRFHHHGDITIGNAADYAMKLRAAHVIVDHAEREALVREGAQKAADDAGLVLVEDEGLVIENAGLTEWPVPLLGRFDEAFLEVPPEVIQLTARVNQKYFICRDAAGKLANAFVCTANIAANDGGAVIVAGNRKVLAARLSDARFFWEQDRKTPLSVHAEKLARITFHEKLGTLADKVERVAKLARWLVEEGIVMPDPRHSDASNLRHSREGGNPASDAAPDWTPAFAGVTKEELAEQAELAARLCKADLVTEMVGEFPELQGLMGGYYARAEGLPDAVADAIRDHYKPVGQGDDVPTAPVTVAVALADKLDTLAGFFAIDERPTGSKDPFALRRSALGVIQILLAAQVRCNLVPAFSNAIASVFRSVLERAVAGDQNFAIYIEKIWKVQPHPSLPATEFAARMEHFAAELGDFEIMLEPYSELALEFLRSAPVVMGKTPDLLLGFFADRLKVQQREAGVRHDLIDAVFALGGEDDLVRLLARVQALQAFVTTEDGVNLHAGYKRAANILKKEEYTPAEADYAREPAEAALIAALDAAEPRAEAAVAAEDFTAAMAALAILRAPIDTFFESVTVNDADPAKRAARLGLLDRFRAAVHKVADFSRIEG
ncbi:MAG: glycine--tRNA ligase subunit beta [Novosphingobium sp.]|uniref:glycine--tRNA ligase subunit beta n=1 Tax=Novosphingobium sp. TaxID=1874826 RepID=UPI003018BB48